MKNPVIVFGNHNKDSVRYPVEKTYPCGICDEPVYVGKLGYYSDKLETDNTPFPHIDRAFDKMCFTEIALGFFKAMGPNRPRLPEEES